MFTSLIISPPLLTIILINIIIIEIIAYFSFFFSTLYKKVQQLSEVLEGAVLLRCHTLLYLVGIFVVCMYKLTCTNFSISIISTFAEAINHTINHMCLGIFITRILCFEGNSFELDLLLSVKIDILYEDIYVRSQLKNSTNKLFKKYIILIKK